MRHVHEMNANGPQWCRANVATITGWVREEIDRRKADHPKQVAAWEQRRAAPEADGDQPRPGDRPALPLAMRAFLAMPQWAQEKHMRALVWLAIWKARWAAFWRG
jgi:hypothetical protein